MIPTLVVLRVDGHGAEHLSLHTRRADAVRAAGDTCRTLWRRRFDYELPVELPHEAVVDRALAEGWRVRISDEPVEL